MFITYYKYYIIIIILIITIIYNYTQKRFILEIPTHLRKISSSRSLYLKEINKTKVCHNNLLFKASTHYPLPLSPPTSNPKHRGTLTVEKIPIEIHPFRSAQRNDDVKRRVPVGASHRADDRRDQSDRTIEKKTLSSPPPLSRSAAAAIIPG